MFVYILCSQKKHLHYVGVTSDVEVRLKAHNAGGTKSTKPYRPWRIVYTEQYNTKTEACKREYFLKSTKGYLEKKTILSKHSC